MNFCPRYWNIPLNCSFNLRWSDKFDYIKVTVIPTEIDFDNVGFMESVTRSLTVANNGQVSLTNYFFYLINFFIIYIFTIRFQ